MWLIGFEGSKGLGVIGLRELIGLLGFIGFGLSRACI